MSENLRQSINVCTQLLNLLEEDCQGLHKNLRGELYDAYKALMQEEIEELQTIRQEILRL